MTLGVAVYLHSHHIEVCPLYAGAVLGTTIGIVVHYMPRPLLLPGMTIDIAVCLHNPQT